MELFSNLEVWVVLFPNVRLPAANGIPVPGVTYPENQIGDALTVVDVATGREVISYTAAHNQEFDP